MRKLLLSLLTLAITTMLVNAQITTNKPLVPFKESKANTTNQAFLKNLESQSIVEKLNVEINKEGFNKKIATEPGLKISRNKSTNENLNVGFKLPEGTFYVGFTGELGSYPYTMLLGPAYTDVNWRNTSDEGTYNWSIPEANGEKNEGGFVTSLESSSDRNPVTNYPMDNYFSNPSLTVTEGSNSGSYTFGAIDSTYMFMGGNIAGRLNNTIGVGNYDPNKKITGLPVKDDEFGIYACANVFEKPAHKYILDSLYIHAALYSLPSDTKLEVVIHQLKEVNQATSTLYEFGDTLATSIMEGISGPVFTDPDAVYALSFGTFNVFDEELGYDIEQGYIEVEDAIMIELKGFKGLDGDFTMVGQDFDQLDVDKNNAYLLYNDENGNAGITFYNGGNTSFLFNLGVTYSYLIAEDTLFEVANEGGTKKIALTSYFSPQAIWTAEEVPSWISMDVDFDQDTWDMDLVLTAEELPESKTGRSATINLTTYGSDLTIFVTQGDGINDPNDPTDITSEIQQDVHVISTNGEFEVTYPEKASQLAIYNISGQIMGKYNLPATGNYKVTPASLTKGIYIMVLTGEANYIETVKVAY